MLLCEIEYNWDQKSAVIGWFFLFEWKKKPLWIITIALQQHCEWTHSQHMLVVCLHVHPRASLLFLLCIFIIIIRRHWAFDDEDSADASIFTSRQRHRCANINANVNVNDEDWVDWMMRIGAMRRYLHRGRGTAHPAPPFYHIIHLRLYRVSPKHSIQNCPADIVRTHSKAILDHIDRSDPNG